MMMRIIVAWHLVTATSPVIAQPVPEGIHSMGEGDVNICGFSAPTVVALEEQITRRPDKQSLAGTSEYRAYATNNRVLTFTTKLNKAHPAVACRSVVPDQDGGSSIKLEISCFNSRETCDWFYREFDALNARTLRGLETKD